MGKMTKEQLIAFSRELAWKIYQVDEDVLDEVVVQVSHTIMSLDMLARIEEGKIMFKDYVAPPDTCTNPYLLGYWETEESLEESIPRNLQKLIGKQKNFLAYWTKVPYNEIRGDLSVWK